MVRCRSKYHDKAQWVSLNTYGAKPRWSCFQHAADSQKIALTVLSSCNKFPCLSPEHPGSGFSAPNQQSKRVFRWNVLLELFFFCSLPLIKNSSWFCKNSLWEVYLAAAGMGGSKRNYPIPHKHPQGSREHHWDFLEITLWRELTTARINWMST